MCDVGTLLVILLPLSKQSFNTYTNSADGDFGSGRNYKHFYNSVKIKIVKESTPT